MLLIPLLSNTVVAPTLVLKFPLLLLKFLLYIRQTLHCKYLAMSRVSRRKRKRGKEKARRE
jgi:hypothetical protein